MNDLVLQRRISAPRPVVFSFLIDPAKLQRWLGISAEVAARVGGRLRIDMTGADVMEGRYLEITEPSRVSFSWGWVGNDEVPPESSTVTIDLVDDGDATLLTLTHADLPDDHMRAHGAGWTYFLSRLRTAGTGSAPGPVSTAALAAATPILEEDE